MHQILQKPNAAAKQTSSSFAKPRSVGGNTNRQSRAHSPHSAATYDYAFSRIPVHSPAPIRIQPKLTIGAAGDAFEQEADRIADQVMRMPEPRARFEDPTSNPEHSTAPAARVQTKSMNASDGGGIEAPPIVHEVLNSPGQPLDAATREFFEPRFGRDFSHVLVHADQRAAEAASSTSARAFTSGRSIVFDANRYAPATEPGRRLLSHELAHVVQQGGVASLIRRQLKTGEKDKVKDGDPQKEGDLVLAEEQFRALVKPLRKKKYEPARKTKNGREEFNQEAIIDSKELMAKLTKPIEKYLRSPEGIDELQSFEYLRPGHSLQLFASDWEKLEHGRHRMQDMLGSRLGGFLFDTTQRATSLKAVARGLGDLGGDRLAPTDDAKAKEVSKALEKTLADSPRMNRVFVRGQQILNTPAIASILTEISILALYRPDGREAIKELVLKHGANFSYEEGGTKASAGFKLEEGKTPAFKTGVSQEGVYELDFGIKFPKGGEPTSKLHFDQYPLGKKNKLGGGVAFDFESTSLKLFELNLNYQRNDNVKAGMDYKISPLDHTQQISGGGMVDMRNKQVGFFGHTEMNLGKANTLNAMTGAYYGSKNMPFQVFGGVGLNQTNVTNMFTIVGVKKDGVFLGIELMPNGNPSSPPISFKLIIINR